MRAILDMHGVDPALSAEVWRYLVTVAAIGAMACVLIYKVAMTRYMESLRQRVIGRRGQHGELRRTT